jgi:hypothetical protein
MQILEAQTHRISGLGIEIEKVSDDSERSVLSSKSLG